MKVNGLAVWLLCASFVGAWPGVRRRQAQSSSDTCTCPANAPVTTTVTEYTIVTSSTTVTSQDGTVFSTGPASTSVVTESDTSTATVITGTTVITQTSTTTIASDSTTTITATATQTTCIAGPTRKAKRQNSDSSSTTGSTTDSRPIITFTSTISSNVVTCTCTPRPSTSTLAGSSSSTCQCPATASTITVTSTSSGVVVVTVVSNTPTVVTITPTELYTTTVSTVTTSSDLATIQTTQTSSTVTIQTVATVYTTSTSTLISCPPSSSTTSSSSSTSSTPVPSQSGSFGCNATAYFIATNPSTSVISLYNINLQTGSTITFATNVGGGTYSTMNGMGFNSKDNFLYAIGTLSSTSYAVLRITTTGGVQELLRFSANSNPGNVGDFDLNGQFWFSGGGTSWYQMDLLPGSSTYGTIVNKGTSTLDGYTLLDWSYLGGAGNYMYSLARSSDSSPHFAVLRWSLDDQTWSVYQDFPGTSAPNAQIANWGGNNGTIWGLSATTGRITRVVLGGTPTALGVGPTGINGGDGARCALSS